MTSASPRLSRVSLAAAAPIAAALTLAFAAAIPAPAASTDYYLKLGGVEGESTADKGHKKEIEILSWSWGASQPATSGAGGGMGAGKVAVHDISVAPAPATGEAEITLKGDAGAAAEGARKRPGKVKYGDITLKRGTVGADSGGASVAAGDLDGDGRAERKATPKLSETVVTKAAFDPRATPPASGSVTLALRSPWAGCRVGARYPDLELGGTGALTYKFKEVLVSSCSGSSGSDARPMESVSFNYAKVEY